MQTWQLVLYGAIATVVVLALAILGASGTAEASDAERKLAKYWLWLRRLLCFLMAALCLLLLGYMIVTGRGPNGTRVYAGDLVWMFILLGGLAYFLVHVGRYGAARKGSTPAEDREVDRRRRKRYGWRE